MQPEEIDVSWINFRDIYLSGTLKSPVLLVFSKFVKFTFGTYFEIGWPALQTSSADRCLAAILTEADVYYKFTYITRSTFFIEWKVIFLVTKTKLASNYEYILRCITNAFCSGGSILLCWNFTHSICTDYSLTIPLSSHWGNNRTPCAG